MFFEAIDTQLFQEHFCFPPVWTCIIFFYSIDFLLIKEVGLFLANQNEQVTHIKTPTEIPLLIIFGAVEEMLIG